MFEKPDLTSAKRVVDAWLHDGSLPATREDTLAKFVAAAALTFTLIVALMCALLPAPAAAATPDAGPAPAPSLELAAFRVVPAASGKPEQLVTADQARIGDLIQYVATYRNPTGATLHHVKIDVPVPPAGVEYVLETATPHADGASTDGKRFAPLPLLRTETLADGTHVTKPAPAADYHALRWDLGDIAPGTSRAVSARVRVGAATAPAPTH